MARVGQLSKYSDPLKLAEKIDEYFESTEKVTITGLCVHCGFASRQSLTDYEKREGFSDIIKRARLIVENVYEKKLHGTNTSGSIFALKNMGWSDNQNVSHDIHFSDISDDELISKITKLVNSGPKGRA